MKDRGSSAVEYMGTIGIFLFVIMVCFCAYAAFGAVEGVENAARTGARTASMQGLPAGRAQALSALPGWLNEYDVRVTAVDEDTVRCEVWARVPVLIKGLDLDLQVTRSAEMPVS